MLHNSAAIRVVQSLEQQNHDWYVFELIIPSVHVLHLHV